MLSTFLALALCQAPQKPPVALTPPKPAATAPTCPDGKCPAAAPDKAKPEKPKRKLRLFRKRH